MNTKYSVNFYGEELFVTADWTNPDCEIDGTYASADLRGTKFKVSDFANPQGALERVVLNFILWKWGEMPDAYVKAIEKAFQNMKIEVLHERTDKFGQLMECFEAMGRIKAQDIETMRRELKNDGYEGLYHPEGYCACNLTDLMKNCDDMGYAYYDAPCRRGVQVPCRCGEGCSYHIVPKEGDIEAEKGFWDTMKEVFDDAKNWRCTECGKSPDDGPNDGSWRYAGSIIGWEHHHGYPVGHVQAERIKS